MIRFGDLIGFAIPAVVAVAIPFTDSVGAPRDQTILPAHSPSGRDTLMAWDDGDNGFPPVVTGGEAGTRLAVKFTAPAWASHVTAIHYYIESSAQTLPFVAWVWQPDGEVPGAPGNVGQEVAGGYAGDAWLELALTSSIDISDEAEYPGRVFFVGLEFLWDVNPEIGADLDEPIDDMTYLWDGASWEPLELADAMVRVVVSDTATPIEEVSWASIKALSR